MAKIRKIYDQTIKPDGSKTTIYPITSTRAVYTPDGETLDSYIKDGYFHGADLRGYKTVSSVEELPTTENQFGWLIGEDLYVWVGTGGDTLGGLYQNCGHFRTPYVPDDEDLVADSNNELKLKDRTVEDGGMGYVILRKNKSFAEQVVNENTIYEIRYDFDLAGGSVTIPSGCVLKFNGGSISNGTITLNNTYIEGKSWCNCALGGTCASEARTSWCKAQDSEHIQNLLNAAPSKLFFDSVQDYSISVEIKGDVVIDGCDNIFNPLHKPTPYDYNFPYHVFYSTGEYDINIQNCKFVDTVHSSISTDFQENSESLIQIRNAKSAIIKDCLFKDIEGWLYTGPINYGEGIGLIISCTDVKYTRIDGCEFTNITGQEQCKVLTSNNGERSEVDIDFVNNYIHDEAPLRKFGERNINGSVTDFVAGNINVINNRVDNFNFDGSLFNFFGTNVMISGNEIKNCRASSIFDCSEFDTFDSDNITMVDNYVEAKNSLMLLTNAEHIIAENNVFKGFGFLCAGNDGTTYSNYKWFYKKSDRVQKNKSISISSNVIDCTNYGADNVVKTIGVGNSMIFAIWIRTRKVAGEQFILQSNKIFFDSILKEDINSTITTATYRPVVQIENMLSAEIIGNWIEGFNNSSYFKFPVLFMNLHWHIDNGGNLIWDLDEDKPIIAIEKIVARDNTFSGYSEVPNNDTCLPVSIITSTEEPFDVKNLVIKNNTCDEKSIVLKGDSYSYFNNVFIDSLESDINNVSQVPIFISDNPKLSTHYDINRKNIITRNGCLAVLQQSGPVLTPSPFIQGQEYKKGSVINIDNTYYLVGRTFVAPETISLTAVADSLQLYTTTIGTALIAFKQFISAKNCFYLESPCGTTRPTDLQSIDAGFQFFDTSLSPSRVIWWNGAAWVDATGQAV